MKILLVEDHEDTRNMLASLLARGGHTTMIAKTVAEAVTLLGRRRFHALLCDRGLPDGDGLDVAFIAKQLNPDFNTIALTALDSDDNFRAGFDAGFDHYLTKPFDLGELRRLLS